MNKHTERLNHPRPQFVREEWIDLCGTWEFEFDQEDRGIKEEWFKKDQFSLEIKVPFVYQSSLSEIESKQTSNIVWYKRKVTTHKKDEDRLLLNFEAVDYHTKVWVNGEFVGQHRGGFVPFTFDITDQSIHGANEIVVRVEDDTSCSQPLGKQSWKDENFLCWYTKTTGIWQPVWIEIVPDKHIKELYMTPDIDSASIEIEVAINTHETIGELRTEIYFNDEFINSSTSPVIDGECFVVLDVSSKNPNFRLEYWNPDTPNLYDVKFIYEDSLGNKDIVRSYFGMRKVEAQNGKILLNNLEFYQKLILDQGYFGEGLMTPPTVDWLVDDVKKMKEFGFNGVRKHQKIEDNRFAYLCDYYGLVMWVEVPSAFRFSRRTKENIWHELTEIIKKHYNNPSVIVWTLFNESWGVNEIYGDKDQQNFVDAAYAYTKSQDSSRLIVGNDGWEHTKTDILTIHDYTQDHNLIKGRYTDVDKGVNDVFSVTSGRKNYSQGYEYLGEPIMISEYGGAAFSQEEQLDGEWGYGQRLTSKEAVLQRFKELTLTIMDLEGVCGFCYTQLSDVEQEVNGLLDHEHNYKFPPEEIRKILQQKRTSGYIFE